MKPAEFTITETAVAPRVHRGRLFRKYLLLILSLVTAALLHDLGHMSNDMGETPTLRGIDDRHQYHGAAALKEVFPQAVLTPIRYSQV